MKITDALLGEHAMLYSLFAKAKQFTSEESSIAELKLLVSVLEDQLGSHAQAEEKLLFPALQPHLGEMGPLAVMSAEHVEVENYFAEANSEEDPDRLKMLINDMIDLAINHFQKEEMVLFGMAKEFLSEDELETLGKDWAIDRKVVIDGTGCPGRNAAQG